MTNLINLVLVNIVSAVYIVIISYLVVTNERMTIQLDELRKKDEKHNIYLNELYNMCIYNEGMREKS